MAETSVPAMETGERLGDHENIGRASHGRTTNHVEFEHHIAEDLPLHCHAL